MSDLVPISPGEIASPDSRVVLGLPSRRLSRGLARVEGRTLLRMALVQAEGMVSVEKLREVDHLAETAITGQTMLRRWSSALANGDPLVEDDNQLFRDVAKIAKSEIIADAVDTFRREG